MSVEVVTVRNWQWRQVGEAAFNAAADPSSETAEIFTDLLAAKKIPDPFIDRNERLVQWVAEADWEYEGELEYTRNAQLSTQDLIFEGLDTIATVTLNGEEILKSDNMFHIHRVNVNGKLKEGKNTLRVHFASALKRGHELADKYGHLEAFNGDRTRVYVRKAQYHYGWDWGPVLMTCGPFKPVRLESYAARLSELYADVDVSADLRASIEVQVETLGDGAGVVAAEVELVSPSGESVATGTTKVSGGKGSAKFTLDKPELWYPVGYGKQPLYEVKATLKGANGEALDSCAKRFGVRRLELVQEPLKEQEGSSFFFRVNNVPVFCAGSNWIPAHNYITAITNDDYRTWISRIVDCNQVMVRVWGGGIYEPDFFYEECDRVGVLVWQDFMFACGQYPYYKEMAESVRREARDQVKRLRHFCSIVIYAGNNEDYQVQEQLKLTDKQFPAKEAYEKDFPAIVGELCRVPYHPGSPWGGKNSSDPLVGDIHQWNVWHGSQEKYQNWGKLGGRFVSEFGMMAFPCIETIKSFVTEKSQLYPQSLVVEHHDKADGFERRLALYVMENLRVRSMDLESWIYATQLMQSECLAYAYRCWRRQWKGPGREYVAGALVWQINDCWPVTSWAICDFYGNAKLAYYAVKRESAPINVGVYRTTPEDKNTKLSGPALGPPHDLVEKKYIFDVWGASNLLEPKEVILKLSTYDATSGKLIKDYEDRPFTLLPNQSTEVCEDLGVDQFSIIYARLVDNDGKALARAGDWPQPLKHLVLPGRVVIVTKVSPTQVKLTTNKPTKGVELYLEGKTAHWQDNGFDLFPGEEYLVNVTPLEESDIPKVRFYEQEEKQMLNGYN
ncbi:hypothetical protein TRVA0_046S01090 [Trichomonascus vanleenenianus]|uniref:beta-mannosidase n=1 Tax=Trichomonascus vanleenenianus TaxID=2268995 RepID=UPI003ECA3B98